MISFFKKKPTIHSIRMPDLGWDKTKDTDFILQWINPERTIAITINFFNLPPDYASIKNVDLLRQSSGKTIAANNGGLIELNLVETGGIPSVKTIFKFPQPPSGTTYYASLAILFEQYSYVVKVECPETNPTGIREAFVADKIMNDKTIGNDNGIKDWMYDPYDASFEGGTLMNIAEREMYDRDFPFHALTLARLLILEIQNGIEMAPELRKLELFSK